MARPAPRRAAPPAGDGLWTGFLQCSRADLEQPLHAKGARLACHVGLEARWAAAASGLRCAPRPAPITGFSLLAAGRLMRAGAAGPRQPGAGRHRPRQGGSGTAGGAHLLPPPPSRLQSIAAGGLASYARVPEGTAPPPAGKSCPGPWAVAASSPGQGLHPGGTVGTWGRGEQCLLLPPQPWALLAVALPNAPWPAGGGGAPPHRQLQPIGGPAAPL